MLKLEHLIRARKGTCIFLRGFRGEWWIQESTIVVDGIESPVYRAGIYHQPTWDDDNYGAGAMEGVVKYALSKEGALEALLPTINSWIRPRR